MRMDKVNIVGGTHGNEYTGVQLLKKYWAQPAEIQRSSFHTSLVFANPRAHEVNRRFVDADLNRSFSLAELADPRLGSYEANRAKVLNAVLGPKGACDQTQFILDLHTTTANVGLTLIIVNPVAYNFWVAAYVQSQIPETKIYLLEFPGADQPFLVSVRERGIAVEVGPVGHGLLRQDKVDLTRAAVYHVLDAAHKLNCGVLGLPSCITYYRHRDTASYPVEASPVGNLPGAIVHEAFQDGDFRPLYPGSPIFRSVDGTVIPYQGKDVIYPALINEAAYYEKNVAFFVATQETMYF